MKEDAAASCGRQGHRPWLPGRAVGADPGGADRALWRPEPTFPDAAARSDSKTGEYPVCGQRRSDPAVTHVLFEIGKLRDDRWVAS